MTWVWTATCCSCIHEALLAIPSLRRTALSRKTCYKADVGVTQAR